MQYWRCKCGSSQAWGSMPPERCAYCCKCGSDLAQSPLSHREVVPHDFSLVQNIETDQGQATITRCRWCCLTREEIVKRASRKNLK